MPLRGISVLGSTGTIGRFTLELVDAFPGQFKVSSLAAGRNRELLQKQIIKYEPDVVSVLHEEDAKWLKKEFPKLHVDFGARGVRACIDAHNVDVVIVGIVGFAGLEPALHAVRRKKTVGLANKESLVTAGVLFRKEMELSNSLVVPVDSEHNALYQLLKGVSAEEVESIVLTASGGPFLKTSVQDLEKVTPSMATTHPNWKMGPKISVDSATLMNKGLEVIEAHFLFSFPDSKIEVWVHPQSIVHGAVWLTDNTNFAQLSVPDMKSAIGYTLSFPERLKSTVPKLSLSQMAKLEFFEPDNDKFPCLNLARTALRNGQSYVIALNAANEVAVEAFLSEQIRFLQIPQVIDATLQALQVPSIECLEDVYEADQVSRKLSREILRRWNK
ncbi:MAG: 1-deoxy-D-xylulose-5-phosphate reductoisomerase [Proteobacteria bacterium]|nr:1-deoxy-D-xylulose-5-phosphate reductoisomerase [Pseudomonadota bacterium]